MKNIAVQFVIPRQLVTAFHHLAAAIAGKRLNGHIQFVEFSYRRKKLKLFKASEEFRNIDYFHTGFTPLRVVLRQN